MYYNPYGYVPHYSYTPDVDEFFSEASGAIASFIAIFALVYVFLIALSVVCYVFSSLGLYTISKRRGIRHAWLSWLPVGNLWIIGSLSDQYQYVAKGKVQNRRKVLMGLSIALLACGLLCGVGLGMLVAGAIVGESAPSVIGGMLLVVFYLALAALAITLMVFEYIALYSVFVSCDPGNATLFLVLSILFSVTLPFFLFACRKKDFGMPPRRVDPVPPVFQPVNQQPDAEPRNPNPPVEF